MRQFDNRNSWLDNEGKPLIGRISFYKKDTSEYETITDVDGTSLSNPILTNTLGQTVVQVFLQDNKDYTINFEKYIGNGDYTQDEEITNLKSDLKVKQASKVNLNSRFKGFKVKTINVEVQKKTNKEKNNKKKILEINAENGTMKIILNTNLPSSTKWDDDKIWSFGYHKALLGYLNAYFDHCPIKVSPNIIWQLILNAFSSYVDKHSEYLRDRFVNFAGKKDLIFVRIGTFKDIYKYEDGIIEEFCQKISENIGSEIVDNLTPNFSTSTKDTIIAGKVSIMSTFKKYFNYKGGMCLCGIPYIILEGTLEDWEKILKKLEFLSKYGFDIYKKKKNIEEIINTKKGNINYDFWRNIIMETKTTVKELVHCMVKDVKKDVIKGWICNFYNGKDYLERNELKDEVLKVPVHLMQIETNEKKDAIIFTGIRDLKP